MRRVVFTAVVVVGLLTGVAGPAMGQGSWTEEPFPARPGLESMVSEMASTQGATWAFGGFRQSGSFPIHTSQAYLRVGAGEWKETPIPDIGLVRGATAVSAEDAWAVGAPGKSEPGTAAHWDGKAWTEVPPPAGANLYGITSFASNDVWAVGSQPGGSDIRGVIQHWDGKAWAEVPTPEVAVPWSLAKIHGTAPNDVWAIGSTSPTGVAEQPLALHWDGKAWTQVPMPEVEGTSNSYVNINDVASFAPDDVWAAVTSTPYDGEPVPYMMHWDGKRWSVVDIPVTKGYLGDLVRVGSELWAMSGSSGTGDSGGSLLRYDGTTWQQADPPPTGFPSTGTELEDGSLLAVGSADTDNGHQPFAATNE